MSRLAAYVRFWDRREGAESLALVRIGVGLVILFDLLQIVRFDLVRALFTPPAEGGLGSGSSWLGASATSAWLLVGGSVVLACTLSLGLFTRTSALLLLLTSAQLSLVSATPDSGGERLLRSVLCLLALSGAGATWSLDAWFGRRRERQREIPAWPRYLLIAQLVIMYFASGLLKQTPEWTSLGGYSALFRVLGDPHLSRYAWSHEQLSQLYPVLQLGTFVTLMFERSAIVLPVLLWLRSHPGRMGHLGAITRRLAVLPLWIATGVFFHLALAALVKLGSFPWACLVLYPALARPDFWRNRIPHALTGRGGERPALFANASDVDFDCAKNTEQG